MKIRSLHPDFEVVDLEDITQFRQGFGPQCVYVFLDAGGSPLYVGRTWDPAGRWAAHKQTAGWWPQAVSVAYRPIRDELELRATEKELIAILRPRHNIYRYGEQA